MVLSDTGAAALDRPVEKRLQRTQVVFPGTVDSKISQTMIYRLQPVSSDDGAAVALQEEQMIK